MSDNFSMMSPVEIDTQLATLHSARREALQTSQYMQERILDQAGMRKYVRGDNWSHRGRYVNTGTFDEARVVVERYIAAYDAERGVAYNDLSADAKAGISCQEYGRHYLARFDEAQVSIRALTDAITIRNAEFDRRGGWPRKFLVTSSAGHLHADMCCSSCRPTTTYGWFVELSGMEEAEAIAFLGDRADALCSICYPSAPVAPRRTNISKAQAKKLATGA